MSGRPRLRKIWSWFASGAGVPRVPESLFGFHAQQAVEKAAKAVLAYQGVDPPWIHDLAALVDMITRHHTPPAALVEAIDLTPYATTYRYPGPMPATTPLDRNLILRRVEAVCDWSADKVSGK